MRKIKAIQCTSTRQ